MFEFSPNPAPHAQPVYENMNVSSHKPTTTATRVLNQRKSGAGFHKNPSPYSDCEHHEFYDSHSSSQVSPKKTVETSDKSTATINDVATQTEETTANSGVDATDAATAAVKAQTNSYFNQAGGGSGGGGLVEHRYLKKSKLIKHSRESDGKKYLLETYLRNHENIANGGSSTSSGKAVSSSLSTPNNVKKNSINNNNNMISKLVLESGIGTTNDDEADSLQSAQNEYNAYISELKHAEKHEHSNSDKENESFYDTDLYSNANSKKKKIKQKQQQQQQNKQSLAPLSTIHKPSHYEDDSSKSLSPNTCRRSPHISHEKDTTTLRETFSPAESLSTPKIKQERSDENSQFYTISSFLRLVFTALCYIIPLCLLCLFVIVYFFVYYLNPSCCDYQRTYLIWNVI